MTESDFFKEIEHPMVPWQGYHLHVPVFYDHIYSIIAMFLAPYDAVKAELLSDRLYPLPVMPGKAVVSVSAYQYLDCDLDPYNEVIVGIPVSLDKRLPLFTGSFRKVPDPMLNYIHTIAVTTEIARKVGVEFAGYPKFLAQIDFTEEADWLTCEMSLDGSFILSLRGRKLKNLVKEPRYITHPITYRNGYLLRSEMVVSEQEMATSSNKDDAVLTLGDDPISQTIKKFELGAPSNYIYGPNAQGVLTPVIESFKA